MGYNLDCPGGGGCTFRVTNRGRATQHLVHKHDWRRSDVAEWWEATEAERGETSTDPPGEPPPRPSRSAGDTGMPAAGGDERGRRTPPAASPPARPSSSAVDEDWGL